jgi:hypothetical protein
MTNKKRGFIALMTVIVLGFVLYMTVLSLGSRSVGTRFILLDLEMKDVTDGLAAGCVQTSIIDIVNDPGHTISSSDWKIVDIKPYTCAVFSVDINTPTSGKSRIRATASTTRGITTNVEAIWDTVSEEIESYKEVAIF